MNVPNKWENGRSGIQTVRINTPRFLDTPPKFHRSFADLAETTSGVTKYHSHGRPHTQRTPPALASLPLPPPVAAARWGTLGGASRESQGRTRALARRTSQPVAKRGRDGVTQGRE